MSTISSNASFVQIVKLSFWLCLAASAVAFFNTACGYAFGVVLFKHPVSTSLEMFAPLLTAHIGIVYAAISAAGNRKIASIEFLILFFGLCAMMYMTALMAITKLRCVTEQECISEGMMFATGQLIGGLFFDFFDVFEFRFSNISLNQFNIFQKYSVFIFRMYAELFILSVIAERISALFRRSAR